MRDLGVQQFAGPDLRKARVQDFCDSQKSQPEMPACGMTKQHLNLTEYVPVSKSSRLPKSQPGPTLLLGVAKSNCRARERFCLPGIPGCVLQHSPHKYSNPCPAFIAVDRSGRKGSQRPGRWPLCSSRTPSCCPCMRSGCWGRWRPLPRRASPAGRGLRSRRPRSPGHRWPRLGQHHPTEYFQLSGGSPSAHRTYNLMPERLCSPKHPSFSPPAAGISPLELPTPEDPLLALKSRYGQSIFASQVVCQQGNGPLCCPLFRSAPLPCAQLSPERSRLRRRSCTFPLV